MRSIMFYIVLEKFKGNIIWLLLHPIVRWELVVIFVFFRIVSGLRAHRVGLAEFHT